MGTIKGSGGFRPSLVTEDIGVSAEVEFLASEHMIAKRGGVTLAASAVSADGDGNKIVEKGTALCKITATGKYAPYVSTGSADEVQTVTVDATGGTFTISFAGETTAAIAANATAAVVEAALEGLANINPGDVTVTRSGSVNAYVYTLTWGGQYIDQDVPAVTTGAGSLTGGAGTATVATTTAGAQPTNATAGLGDPGVNDAVILMETVNLRNGDVIAGALQHGSVIESRCTGVDDLFKARTQHRITYV